jgi:D-alanyl-D-alanine carboxypeptidase
MWPGVIAAGVSDPPVLTDGGYPPLRLYPEHVRAIQDLSQPPELSVRAALVMDLDTGQVLYAQSPDEPLPPASTVKVMTALVALENNALDERVTVSENCRGYGPDGAGCR